MRRLKKKISSINSHLHLFNKIVKIKSNLLLKITKRLLNPLQVQR